MAEDFPETLDTVDDGGAFPETLDTKSLDAQGSSATDFPETLDDSAFSWDAPTVEPPSKLGTAVRRGLIEAPAGAFAGLAGMLGSIPGAAAGTLTSPVTGPVGPIVGGLATGIPAAMAAGEGAHRLQDFILDQLGLKEGVGQLSEAQEVADRLNNPGSAFTGELLGGALPSFGAGIGRTAAGKIGSVIGGGQRVLGGGLQAGMETGREVYQGEDLDPAKIAGAGAVGLVLAKPRAWMNPALRPIDKFFNPQEPRGLPGPRLEGEVLPPEQAPDPRTQKFQQDVDFATHQRDGFPKDGPMWNFWNEHIIGLQDSINNSGKGRAQDEDAQWGPPKDGEFTYTTPEDMSRANDVTTTSVGIAHENSRAPEVSGAGNPVGAPMEGRIAQRPGDPGRDYRKLPAPERGAEEVGTTAGDHAPDVLQALTESQIETGIAQATPAEGQYPWQPSKTPQAPPNPDAVLEQSRLQREAQQAAVQEANGRSRGMEGEPIQLPDQSAPVTAAVTHPPEVIQAREALAKAGMDKVVQAIDQLPHEQQGAAFQKATDLMSRANKAEYDKTIRPKTETGVQARSKADEARKSEALRAVDQAVQEHPRGADELEIPTALRDKAVIQRRLAKMLDRAKELYGSHLDTKGQAQTDPLHYKPRKQPPSMVLARAAQKVVAKPTPANIQAFRAAEAAAKGKSIKDVDATADIQQTRAIEAGIEKRPSADADLEAAAPVERERVVHESLDNSNGDESAVFKNQHDDLTNWLNGLGDTEYKALAREHPELDLNVRSTQDPHELHTNLLDDLAAIQRKNPPRLTFDAVPAEDGAVIRRTPIKTAKDVAASEGRRIDPNSAEGKAIAAGALARQPKANPRAEDLEALEREGAQNPPKIDGGDKSALEHWAAFMADEGGAIPLDRVLRKMATWMKTTVKDFFTPTADPHVLEYGKQIGLNGVKLNTDLSRIKANALAAARVATFPDGKVPLPAEMGQMYRAAERGTLNQLDPKLQKYYADHVQPRLDQAAQAYDELRDASIRLKLPGHEEMPERKTNGAGFIDWLPRRRKFGPDDLDYDPISNKGLSNWAQSAQERDWFTLQNKATGERKLYRVNADGDMVFYQNRQAGSAKTPPAGFDPRDIGATLRQSAPGIGHNSGASQKEWIVDNSSIDELMTHGQGDKGKPLLYSQNPVFVALDAYIGLKSALARVKLLDNIISDPDFAQLSTPRKAVAEERWGKNNFAETILPQMKGRQMPKPVAWALDDLVKQGFNYNGNRFMEGLARTSQALMKPFYFIGPEVHVFNELDKYLVGSGYENLTRLGRRQFFEGVKSVWAQDGTQTRIMDAGGNPMYMHALTARIMPQIGKLVGEDMVTHPWKYDPLFKMFGIDTKNKLASWYQGSNKFMWMQSDMLYTARFLENVKKGMSDRDAVIDTEKMIDSYVVPTTMGKSLGLEATDAGRALQKVLTDQTTALFGRYSYGLYHTIGSIAKNMLGPNSTKAQRAMGVSQVVMLVAMANVVYPLLSAGYSKITGNPHSEFEQRGVTRLATVPARIARGEKDITELTRRMFTPAVPLDTVFRQLNNQDFAGRKIIDPASSAGKQVGQEAEFLAGQAVSPLKPLSQGAEQGGAGFAAQRFIESNFGLKTPSPAATKREQQLDKILHRDAKTREKHPRGLIERGFNKVFGR